MERKLTTEQMEILMLLNEITEYVEKETIELDVELNEVIACGFEKDGDLVNEITEQLETYGYVDEDSVPTYAGKRYLELFMEYVKKQKEQPQTVINNKDTVVNNSYSLISIEELKLSFEGPLLETNNELMGNVNMIISNIFNK